MDNRQTAGSLMLAACVVFLAGCLSQHTLSGSQTLPPREKGTKTMEKPLPTTPVTVPPGREVATIAGGCFWCTEAIFLELKGVEKVVSGYAGGHVENPSYEQVCTGRTGHAEAIQITYDPKVISYENILRVFFTTHDPTTLNRQGADVGPQYRSAVFYHNDSQKRAAEAVIREITAEGIWKSPIVTEVTAFSNFYAAEEYHQNYYARNSSQPYCRVVIEPKVAKFRQKYQSLLKR
jgi:peptide-methionine (S)-S-oxide reductase